MSTTYEVYCDGHQEYGPQLHRQAGGTGLRESADKPTWSEFLIEHEHCVLVLVREGCAPPYVDPDPAPAAPVCGYEVFQGMRCTRAPHTNPFHLVMAADGENFSVWGPCTDGGDMPCGCPKDEYFNTGEYGPGYGTAPAAPPKRTATAVEWQKFLRTQDVPLRELDVEHASRTEMVEWWEHTHGLRRMDPITPVDPLFTEDQLLVNRRVTPVTEPGLTADKVHLSEVSNPTPESCEPPADPVVAGTPLGYTIVDARHPDGVPRLVGYWADYGPAAQAWDHHIAGCTLAALVHPRHWGGVDTSAGPVDYRPYYLLSPRAKCPDGGTCHHECSAGDCFRVARCGPLTGVYPGDGWPPDVMARVADIHGAAQRQEMGPGVPHHYLSTACYHADEPDSEPDHERCKGVCKWCPAPCVCPCGHPHLLKAGVLRIPAALVDNAPDPDEVLTAITSALGSTADGVLMPRIEIVEADGTIRDTNIGTSNSDAEPVAEPECGTTGHNWNPAETCPCSTDPTANCEFPEVMPDE